MVVGLQHHDRVICPHPANQFKEIIPKFVRIFKFDYIVHSDKKKYHIRLETAHPPVITFFIEQLDRGLTADTGVDDHIIKETHLPAHSFSKNFRERPETTGVRRPVSDRISIENPRPRR